MNIKPIRTEQDYKAALKAISPLFDNQSEIGSPEFDYPMRRKTPSFMA